MTFGMTGSITGTRTSVLEKTEESNRCGIEPLWNRTNVESNQCGQKFMWNVIIVEKINAERD